MLILHVVGCDESRICIFLQVGADCEQLVRVVRVNRQVNLECFNITARKCRGALVEKFLRHVLFLKHLVK